MYSCSEPYPPPQADHRPHFPPRVARRRTTALPPLGLTLLVLSTFVASTYATPSLSSPHSIHHSRGLHPKTLPPGPECNPFAAPGWLEVDVTAPLSNRWIPFAAACPSSTFMSSLYRAEQDNTPLIPEQGGAPTHRKFLPWFQNRTVIAYGDSIDRYHVKDFCELVKWRLFNVGPGHPAYPPPYRLPHVQQFGADGQETKESLFKRKLREEKERGWEAKGVEGAVMTGPWVCDIEEYGATFISVFMWGLEGAEEFFETDRWYHPPATWGDRWEYLNKPLLEGLAAYLDRPNIMYPDLIEMNSGYWDLRKYTEEDFTAAGHRPPYPTDSKIPYTDISLQRQATWERLARVAIKTAARTFPGEDGTPRNGPPILWRTLHRPAGLNNYTPWTRVEKLNALHLKVISDLQSEASQAPLYLQDAGSSPGEDLGLDERLRLDYTGHCLLGHERHFRDNLHPALFPGGWLWGDIILYELKRAVERAE